MSTRTDEIETFKAKARILLLSKEAVERFIDRSTIAQIRVVESLLDDEQEVRTRRKKERLFRKAKFPQVKSFDDYDFSQIAFPEGYTSKDLMSLDFIKAAQDFVFHGQTGRGKTHLAIAIGVACVNAGMNVRFFTTAELVMALMSAAKTDTLERL